ncbi:hypothetical protein MN608_06759 [Microdochium nivale]|nr:hypothetical protein MN608_06759 [Microdochium nivale]
MSSTSAPFGQPAATEGDYFVTRGLFRMYGVSTVDPAAGFVLALRPPPGYVFETKAKSIVVGSAFVALAMIIPTTARLVLRGRKGSVLRFGWDDWTILLAMIVGLGYPVTQMTLPLLGAAGIHTWDMNYEQYRVGFKGAMIARSIFYVTVGLTKLSITLFVRRMAYRTSLSWQRFIDAFLATIIAYVLLAICWNTFACNPIDAHGDLEVRGRGAPPVCTDYYMQTRVLAAMHVAQGVILLFTPIVFLWKVRMDQAKKIRLYVIWIVGALAISGGILRELRPDPSADLSWNYTEILVWTSVDLTLELLVASLPVLDGALVSGWHKATAHMTEGISSRAQNSTTNSSGRHKRWPGGGYQPTSETTVLHTKASARAAERDKSDSRESIVQKRQGSDAGIEMTILRTQEVHLLYSPKQEQAGHETSTPRKDFYLDRHEWRQDVVTPASPVVLGAAKTSAI